MALLTSSSVSVPRPRTSDERLLELLGEGVEHGDASVAARVARPSPAQRGRISVTPSRTVSCATITRCVEPPGRSLKLRHHLVALVVGRQDAAAAQRVVGRDQAASARAWAAPPRSSRGSRSLSASMKHEVERAVERGERLERRAAHDLDAIAPAASVEVALARTSALGVADLAASRRAPPGGSAAAIASAL